MTIIEACLIIVLGLLGFKASVIMDFVRDSFDNLQKLTFNDICIKLITSLFWLKAQIEMKAEYLYINYSFVREYTDRCCYAVGYVMAISKGYNIEPYGNNWVSITTVEENNQQLVLGDKYSYTEKYYHINPENYTSIAVNDYYNQCKVHICHLAKSRCITNVMETLVTMKVFGNYLYAPYFNVDNVLHSDYELPITAGQLQFLTIEYTHPKMSDGIVINLTKNMYCNTNRILTPLFVKRYLEHQEKPYVFDYKYTINIMDNCINMFSLKSNQHIYLHDKKYDVVTVYPMAEEPEEEPEEESEEESEEEPEEEPEEELEENKDDTDEIPALIPIGDLADFEPVETLHDDEETTRENYTFDQDAMEVEM